MGTSACECHRVVRGGRTASGRGTAAWCLQVAVKALGVILVLPLFAPESHGLFPGVKALVFALAVDVATQVALVYLLLQVVSAVLGTLFQRPLIALAARLSPPTVEESLAGPRYSSSPT